MSNRNFSGGLDSDSLDVVVEVDDNSMDRDLVPGGGEGSTFRSPLVSFVDLYGPKTAILDRIYTSCAEFTCDETGLFSIKKSGQKVIVTPEGLAEQFKRAVTKDRQHARLYLHTETGDEWSYEVRLDPEVFAASALLSAKNLQDASSIDKLTALFGAYCLAFDKAKFPNKEAARGYVHKELTEVIAGDDFTRFVVYCATNSSGQIRPSNAGFERLNFLT